MILLAHRGAWTSSCEQNSSDALSRALRAGHGFETDIRDLAGKIVVSHDMPSSDTLPMATAIEIIAGIPLQSGRRLLGWNVKADGLAAECKSLLGPLMKHSFFFDMSVPDIQAYLDHDLAVFARHSDVEPVPAYYDQAVGVWVDELHRNWITRKVLRKHHKADKMIAIVSRELHGRNYFPLWEELKPIADWPNLMLCTDLINQAEGFFYGGRKSDTV